ncbi:hypothetical protein JYU19_01515, partial [bacterium AH-315-J21]|nr:hypothetical protein [bacterium AH-315-J21]
MTQFLSLLHLRLLTSTALILAASLLLTPSYSYAGKAPNAVKPDSSANAKPASQAESTTSNSKSKYSA